MANSRNHAGICIELDMILGLRHNSSMAKILVLNGPNLNLLGIREPDHYGDATLDDIDKMLQDLGKKLQLEVFCFQSNAESALVDAIQQALGDGVDFIIINPAAFTHTSIALRDALLGVAIPFIEVHLSNIHAREEFRQNSFLADHAIGTLCGFGAFGYELALLAAKKYLDNPSTST